MKKYFINYASGGFKNSQREALERAKEYGFSTQGYSEIDLDLTFSTHYKKILTESKGAGYWLWKPYIIKQKLKEINKGDYLIYMDSGGKFIKDPTPLLTKIDEKGLLTFHLTWLQSQFTKANVFEAINGPDDFSYRNYLIVMAGCIMMKKCDFVESFIDKWLHYCSYYELISDYPSPTPNFPEFIDARHDQSIFSLLVHKYGVKNIPQIDQYRTFHGLFDDEVYIDFHGIRK